MAPTEGKTGSSGVIDTLRWNRASYWLMSGFLAVVLLIIVVWWPLARDYLATVDPRYPLWRQLDWLLLGNFAGMSLLIMARPDLSADLRMVAVGLVGGLVIESWGTQTSLWTYYTLERPPLWIIPAWPIASLAIDRLYRLLGHLVPAGRGDDAGAFRGVYWVTFGSFFALLVAFAGPTLDKSFTWLALLLCLGLIVTPTDHRAAVLIFAAGSALGYFLERWGTTRECWTYYTRETPPLFAVLAHGMAAVAFWRAGRLAEALLARLPTGTDSQKQARRPLLEE